MTKKLAIVLFASLTLGCSTPTTTPSQTASPSTTGAPMTPIADSSPEAAETTTVAAPLPDGWTEAESKDGKMKMALPPSWVVSDSDNPEVKKQIADLVKENPAFAQANTSNYYFMAMSSKPKDNFSDNVNVVKKPLPQTIPFDDATAAALKQELTKAMPVEGELEMELTKVPQGNAYRYNATLKLSQGGGKELKTYVIGYMLFQSTDMYILTFTTSPKSKDGFAETVATAMETFKITP